MIVHELTVWADNAPVLSIDGSLEFAIWSEGAPVLDRDEAGTLDTRRLAFIF